jgi:uncharacterized membrane protein YhiD involved in acid resistance
MLGWLDITLRLGSALLIGAILGLNRELHHKSTGIRTLGLVALGSAIAVLAVAQDPAADASRVRHDVQTILTRSVELKPALIIAYLNAAPDKRRGHDADGK